MMKGALMEGRDVPSAPYALITSDMIGAPAPNLRLLEKGRWPGVKGAEPKVRSKTGRRSKGGARLLCRVCGNPVTTSDVRITVNGAHQHTFANPHGIVYLIGCFSEAPGCIADRNRYTEFAWFAGYTWSIELCLGCGDHLGWLFCSESDCFHGLVLDKIVEERSERDA